MIALILLLIPLYLVIHELSHFIAAFAFGHRLKFRFSLGAGIVPRFIWSMPDAPKSTQRIIAAAGFAGEGIAAFLIFHAGGYLPALFIFAVHLCAYPFYAGDNSDFNYF